MEHHDDFMRTTVTLDSDVARMLDEATHRERRSFKAVLNDALRRGLSPSSGRSTRKAYRVTPHRTQLLAGLDPASLNRLADELEDGSLLRKGSGR
jgi:hypothetical protein